MERRPLRIWVTRLVGTPVWREKAAALMPNSFSSSARCSPVWMGSIGVSSHVDRLSTMQLVCGQLVVFLPGVSTYLGAACVGALGVHRSLPKTSLPTFAGS